MAIPPNQTNLETLLEHGGWVRALARSLVQDQAAAEDLEQETWLAVVERKLTPVSRPRAWLGTVMRNLASTHWREQSARRRREDLVSEKRQKDAATSALKEQPDYLVERMDTFRKLAVAMANLPEPYGTTLYLRFFEGLRIREIAKRMEVPESAAHKRIARGLQMLRGQLESSIGKDWRQHCLAFTVPFAAAPVVAITTLLTMTIRTKIILATASVALLVLSFQYPWSNLESEPMASNRSSDSPLTQAVVLGKTRDTVISREKFQPVASEEKLPFASTVQVTVLDVDGRGMEGVRVFAWMGEELQEEVLTNEAGTVTLTSIDGDGGLLALAPNFLPVVLSQHFDGSAIVVRVNPGETLGGRVTFKRPRTESTPLVIRVISAPFPKPEHLPTVVAELLEELDVRPGFSDTLVDSQGNFHVSGLPMRWAGRIRLPRGFLICSFDGPGESDSSTFIELSQTSTNIALELLELPVFTGRIVALENEAGVANTGLYVSPYMTAARANTTMMGGRTDEDGFFRIPMGVMNSSNVKKWSQNPELAFQSPFLVEVDVVPTNHHAGAAEQLDLSQKTNPWDLGVIFVKSLSTRPILVVDAKHQPIEGALTFGIRLSEPTNALGITEVVLGDDTETVSVGALGFQSVGMPVPASREGDWKIVLKPAAQLHVTWDAPEDFDMSALIFRMESVGDLLLYKGNTGLFAEMRFQESAGLNFAGGGGNRTHGKNMEWFLKPSQAEFFIWGLNPGVPIKAMLVDRVNNEVASSPQVILSAGEARHVYLHMNNLPLPLVGKVVDSSGSPVSGAQLTVRRNSTRTEVRTTPEGSFEFPDLLGPTVTLSVEKYGYANWEENQFALPLSGQPVEIILEEGREMKIFLRDTAGVTYANGYLQSSGETMDEGSGDGGFLLQALPQSSFSIHWGCGGAKGNTWVPANVAVHTIEVPAMASAVLHATRVNAEARQSIRMTFVPSNANALDPNDSFFQRSLVFKMGEKSQEQEIPTLLPGEYIVKYSTWCQTDGQWGDLPLGEQGPVIVAAGQVLELELNL